MKKLAITYVVFAIAVSLLWTSLADSETVYNETWLSLDYFFQYMSRVPTVNLQNLTLRIFTIEIDAVGFKWVGNLLNSFGYVVGITRWIGVAFYNSLLIFIYFVRFFVESTFGIQTDTGLDLGVNQTPVNGAGGGFAGGGGGSW